MAVFGMTGLQEKPEERAVSAAIEILNLLEARYQKTENHIDVGIGINSGPVIAGYISTRERVELSVLGDAVNIASGLESMARPNRILIGPKTSSAVGKRFKLKSLGEVSIKERSGPVQVHEVLPE
jgi:adenylate cyclase